MAKPPEQVKLWEILVPTQKEYKGKMRPVKTRHHRVWDKYVRSLSGGLTILKPAKGQWVNNHDGKLHEERMIPVRIACTESDIKKIVEFTHKHYAQIAVMYYVISDQAHIHYAKVSS